MTLLRLLFEQIFNGVFLKVNKATVNMLHRVEPYVTYGYTSCLFTLPILFESPVYSFVSESDIICFLQVSQLEERQGADLQAGFWEAKSAENCFN